MSPGRITLLVEDLSSLAAALPGDARYPALEHILARGRPFRIPAETPNHLRFSLFGLEPAGPLPVAALTEVSASGEIPAAGSYWLRADPVTMRADMTRVFVTGCGFPGFDSGERGDISAIVRDALDRAGIEIGEESGAPWCFELPQPLAFSFTPLHEALGMDVADALPTHEDARTWKRLMTDIQVDLHQSGVNVKRRAEGRPEVNSVWFWGGGGLPGTVPARFDAVVSDDPVSRGLGVLSGCPVHAPEDWKPTDGRVLVDWVMKSSDALEEAEALERVAERLLGHPDHALRLVDGSGAGWRYARRDRLRFWKREAPLAAAMKRAGAP